MLSLIHISIDDHENKNVQRQHGKLNEERLQEQAQQRAKLHCFKGHFQIGQHIRRDVGCACDNARRACDHALGHVKDRHDILTEEGVVEVRDRTVTRTDSEGKDVYKRQVQDKLKSRQRSRQTGEISLFAGLLKCGECGKSLTIRYTNDCLLYTSGAFLLPH